MSEFNPDALADALLNDRDLETTEQAQPADPGASAPTPPAATEEPPAGDPNHQADPNQQQQQQDPNTPTPTPQANTGSEEWITNVAKIAGVEIKTEDDLKNFIAKAKSAESLESQLEALSRAKEELESNQIKFANDRIQKLNELYAKGATDEQIAAFNRIQEAGELSQMKPLEAVKLALQLRDGLTAEEAEIRIKSTYKLDETVHDPDTVAASNIDLKLDAKKDLEYLEQYKAKVSEAPATKTPEELQAEAQANLDREIKEYRAKAAPIVTSISQEFSAGIKGVNVNGKQGDEAVTIDLPVSEEGRAQVAKWVEDYAAINNIPLDEQGIEHLKGYARRALIVNNFDAIAIDINNKAEERMLTRFNNPGNIKRDAVAPTPDSVAEHAMRIAQQVVEGDY